jgi:hypothetical protein
MDIQAVPDLIAAFRGMYQSCEHSFGIWPADLITGKTSVGLD